MNPLERKPDIDQAALEALLFRAFGSATPISYQRARDGVSTQVYCLNRGGEIFYLRVAEEEHENVAVPLITRPSRIGQGALPNCSRPPSEAGH